jgi:hypothetical protein
VVSQPLLPLLELFLLFFKSFSMHLFHRLVLLIRSTEENGIVTCQLVHLQQRLTRVLHPSCIFCSSFHHVLREEKRLVVGVLPSAFNRLLRNLRNNRIFPLLGLFALGILQVLLLHNKRHQKIKK